MKAFGFAGLRVLFVLLAGVCAAGAFNLPVSTLKVVTPPVKGRALQGCPKLVARELHIVRVIPQRTRSGEQAYRYILNGTIQNRGLAGAAVVGINVTQKKGRGAAKRIALKLLKRRVQPNQRLNVSGDLHLQVQSNPIFPTDNPFPVFTLNVTNLRNDSGQCADARGTAVHISSNAVRRALPAQVRGVSQSAGSLNNSKKPLNWHPSVAPSVAKSQSARVKSPTVSAAAANARRVGEDAARAKQIQQMQKARDLGSPMDQVRRGSTGRQDCSHSSNPAECLQNNLDTGQSSSGLPTGGNGRSTQACLQAGGRPAECMSTGRHGRNPGAGRLTSGPPGDPRDRLKDPRGAASTQRSASANSNSGWSQWRSTEGHDGITGKVRQRQVNGQTQTQLREHNSRTGETRETDSVANKDTDGYISQTVTRDRNGNITERRNTRAENGRIVSDVVTQDRTPRDGGADDPTGQAAPEGSNGPANDNCDWNPALGKCMKSKPDPKGMTSQPGPDGENPGKSPGRATPQVGSEAVTNGGGGDWNTSGRRGFGFGNGGKPLDMKDPGGVAPK